MYKFQGVKVTRKRFWELAELSIDLDLLEEELDKEMGINVEKKLIAELMEEMDKKENPLFCDSCGSRLLLRDSNLGKYLKCSNLEECESVVMV